MADDLGARSGPAGRSWTALGAGAIGLGAFVVSAALDWARLDITLDPPDAIDQPPSPPEVLTALVDLPGTPYSVAYMLGVLGLLGMLASVWNRPDRAARLRLAAAGLGLGLAGVVAAVAFHVQVPPLVRLFGPHLVGVVRTHQPGIYFAAGAIVALVVGVWAAARPGARSRYPRGASDILSRGPGALPRVVAGQGPAVAFVAGLAGAGALVASAMVDWVVLEVDAASTFDLEATIPLGLGNATAGTVYQLGVLFLLAVLGTAVVRPDLAGRMRAGAVGIGLGLLAVLAAVVFEQRDWVAQAFGGIAPVDDLEELAEVTTVITGPGVYLAGGAVVVLIAGVWLAAAPVAGLATAGAAAAVPTPATATVPELRPASSGAVSPVAGVGAQPTAAPGLAGVPAPATPTEAPIRPSAPAVTGPAAEWSGPVGYADGLTVSSSDVIDLDTGTDILRT